MTKLTHIQFSDFISAQESMSASSGSDDDEDFKIQRRHKKSRKHRMSISPSRDNFLKKPNNGSSPQYYQ